MNSYRNRERFQGRPLEVNFLGFRSDTYRLQQAGWQIAEERLTGSPYFRIAIRHPNHHISGMSKPIRKEELLRWEVIWSTYDIREEPVVLRFELAINYMLIDNSLMRRSFVAVDATPRYHFDIEERDLYNEPYFQPIENGKEIFLRKASVEEIIQIALDKQEPEQARIRAARQAEERRENYKRGGQTKAKLIMVD